MTDLYKIIPKNNHQSKTISKPYTYVTLQEFVIQVYDNICRKIDDNNVYIKDIKLWSKFKEKFNTAKVEWKKLISLIIEKTLYIDLLYCDKKYFGIKDTIMYHLANIMIYYILSPSELDDNDIAYKNISKTILFDKINLFFHLLIIKFKEVTRIYEDLCSFSVMHLRLLKHLDIYENETINPKSKKNKNRCKSNISLIKHDIAKIIEKKAEKKEELFNYLYEFINIIKIDFEVKQYYLSY